MADQSALLACIRAIPCYRDTKTTVELIRQVTIWRLGYFDGCNCTGFEVRYVQVELSCHKSSKCLYVSTSSFGPACCAVVAAEVFRQFRESRDPDDAGYFDDYGIRLESYQQAHGGKSGKCNYCAKPRTDALEYLCESCRALAHASTYRPECFNTLAVTDLPAILQVFSEIRR